MVTATRFEMGGRLVALVPIAHERAVKGAELVAAGKVHHLAGSLYLVNGSGDDYIVDIAAGTCDCPDGRAPHDDEGRKFCKHVCAVLLTGSERPAQRRTCPNCDGVGAKQYEDGLWCTCPACNGQKTVE